ncbi:MAG: AraC family transcriptional regulator, partial [Alloalcanivorax venustensis]
MLAPHLHNRPHSHVAASLLVSLGREPIRVQLAGHWITADAVWAAPDVDQALDSDGPVAVLHLDPDHRAWRALRLQGPGGEFPLAAHPRFRACLNDLAAAPSAPAALATRATPGAGGPRPLGPRAGL